MIGLSEFVRRDTLRVLAGQASVGPLVDINTAIMRGLRGNITGFAIPSYIVDTPSGKVPVAHNHVLGRDGDDLLLEDVRGEIWRERGVFSQPPES